jgi:uncharacterized glyoxalase superfamily protein PhnB
MTAASNRSAPPGEVVPGLYYDDVGAAIDWLCGAFGFREIYRYGPKDRPIGAFLAVGESSVALSKSRTGQSGQWDDAADLGPPAGDFVSGVISVRIPDVDAHFEHATTFGARTFGPPTTYRFGERQYTAQDVAGHRWTFTQSVEDVAPEDWGAIPPSSDA